MSKTQCFVWDFTCPADVIGNEELANELKQICKKWVFQLEKGNSGYEHYQGRVSLKVKSRMPHKPVPEIHWSPTTNENKDNDFYVTKIETRLQGPWSDKNGPLYIPRHIRGITLKPWQQDIVNSSNEFDTRHLDIVLDTTGNIGKSTLCTYCGVHGIGRPIPMLPDYKDIMRFVMDTPKSNLYLIDFPRGMNRGQCNSFWAALETIKNGYCYDDRYTFKECYFDPPRIWVFTNTMPNESLLSNDRWRYYEVKNDILIPRGFKRKADFVL